MIFRSAAMRADLAQAHWAARQLGEGAVSMAIRGGKGYAMSVDKIDQALYAARQRNEGCPSWF